MDDKIWTVLRIVSWTTRYFNEKGIDNPRLDAELLLAHSLKTNRLGLYLNYDKPLQKDELNDYKELIKRRINREPLQYIIGHQEFWSLEFNVSKGVLIPRPETEILVEEILKILPPENPVNILDLGTGSGIIAIAMTKELQKGFLVATDISDIAIRIARENASTHGVERYITFLKGSLFHPLKDKLGFFNLIVSNPPYIPSTDFKYIQREVRDFEPRIALDGGEEGLRFYRQIVPQASRYLKKDGWLILEIGKGQSGKVAKLIESTGEFHSLSITDDLSGIERVIKARKKGASFI